ncbi:MAG: AAA family ATPase [Candidatus Aminicenantes bacterium]|nr:AAA family ATPase [Candidatus Aminicenantes bacterium]NIM81266.1 AAA family ATPase [Candidatus Aminicenantes bacterium]NIN20665.1 AAA family ATPase [Candidatus Aminicenantes bacterium]NIN44444.1 AAA family ATPase [Candidatus Aminicenantes bacterium]NIN87263.1 AAA family ATPase [Candidatus Aminicenantes bacterium]
MAKNKLEYKKDAAFIDRETELKYLRDYIDIRPESILFLHGPKSSGKTTLLYKFFEQVEKEQKLDVKFINMRKIYTEFPDDYNYKEFLRLFFNVEDKTAKEKKTKWSGGVNVGFFKINSQVEKGIYKGRIDPFKVMEKEFITLTNKGIKPVLIIDELQALDKIYLNNGKDRRLIVEFFNFFVAMSKESHLAHIIVASSDGYFLNTVHNDSKLKKSSDFYKVDYLVKDDVMEWLLNLEKYSKIKDYTLTEEDAEKIWDTVGGSMWEIQDILSQLFEYPIDEVLANYKQKMLGMITYYIVQKERKKKEEIFSHFIANDNLWARDTNEGDAELLRDMVTNNVLYFDPTRAVYYPHGKSYHWGIRLYFEGLT